MIRKPKPPKQKVKLFKPKPKFRKKLPIKAAKPMVIHKKSSKIEQDEAEIDYSVAGALDQKPQKKKPKKKDGKSLVDTIKRYPMSRKRKHLLFMNPGDFPVQTAILAITRGNPLRVGPAIPGSHQRKPGCIVLDDDGERGGPSPIPDEGGQTALF